MMHSKFTTSFKTGIVKLLINGGEILRLFFVWIYILNNKIFVKMIIIIKKVGSEAYGIYMYCDNIGFICPHYKICTKTNWRNKMNTNT